MAGLCVVLGGLDRSRIAEAASRLKMFDEATTLITEQQFCAAWVSHDDPVLFAPAFDPKTGIHVITSGRVSCDESEWQRAERLTQYRGGLSNRLLLERYIERGPDAMNRHNGPAALVIWDPRNRTAHLWTDHFGYHPIFLYGAESARDVVISTFPDAIADDPAVHVTSDEVAMAEFLSAWRITPPHTYYREVKYAGAATHHAWDLTTGRHTRAEYWAPYTDDPFPDLDSAAEELAMAVTNAVRIRTLPRLGPIVSYTSGGMDSRAVLFAAASPSDMVAVNIYDVPNNEARISHLLADAAGVRYAGFARDSDYYPRLLTEGARLSGSMWSTEDNHFLGTRQFVRELGARTVMTACTTDWLFKGYGLEMRYQRVAGRNLPIKALVEKRVDGFLPNVPRPVPEGLRPQVTARLDVWFHGTPSHMKVDRDWLRVEDRRIRPACYAVSVSGQIMYRVFPYDTFLADARVADCYARSRAAWKLNSDLWGKAVRRICRNASDIEDANFGWRVGSSTLQKLGVFGSRWLKRRFAPRQVANDGPATDGSWPNYGWYVRNSLTLRRLWDSTPKGTRDVIAAAWGSDPWQAPLSEWSNRPNDLFRILTLAEHVTARHESAVPVADDSLVR